MSTSCMQAIKQQLEAMPLEEFEDLLKGVAVSGNKGHEARTQHGELISQLKHHVKVQPDEPIQSKPTDKECKKIWSAFSQENKSQFPSTSSSSISEGSNSTGVGNSTSTINGNIHTGTYLPNSSHRSSVSVSDSTSTRSISACGDQNANPVASNSSNCSNITDNASSLYPNSSVHNSIQGRYHNYNNHHGHQSTFSSYSNSLDRDPGGYSSRRSHERDRNINKNVDNTLHTGSSSNKSSVNSYENTKSKDDDDDDTQETYLDPEEFIGGSLPPQYILPGVTKFNSTSKDLPLQLYSKPQSSCPLPITPLDSISPQSTSSASHAISAIKSSLNANDDADDQPGTSKEPWNLRINKRPGADLLQLKDGYKSVSSITSGSIAPTYMGRSITSTSEDTYGSVHAVSPTLPSGAMLSKSPTIDGSQSDKPTLRRGAGKKKSSKNVLRETVINPQEMPGYKGTEDIDKLLEFVLGNQTKVTKKTSKDKKQQQHGKPAKGNEKQVLSKAASLDENSLGYGSKKSNDDTTTSNGPRNRNSKDVEKRNSTNITKSASAICDDDDASILSTSNREVTTKSPSPPNQHDSKSTSSSTSSSSYSCSSIYKSSPQSQPLVNGGLPPSGPKAAGGKTLAASVVASGGNKTASLVAPKNPNVIPGTEKPVQAANSEVPVANSQKSEISPVAAPNHTLVSEPKQEKSIFTEKIKSEDDRFAKPDESDGPYVLVQSKKKREKKKPQRESEHFVRSHPEQARREGVRPRRSNTERRKSVGSVPGSENSECSDDDDSVRSLPAGECTPRERIPKPCSSSGGTPQTSYADIARMSKDENGKTPPSASSSATVVTPPIAIAPAVPKTPISTAKTSPPTVVAAVTTPEDVNFPALSPSTSSEKTVTTPVNAAVWTCRPRIAEMETPVKTEKQGSVMNNNNSNSNSNKPEDACANYASSNPVNMDGGFPPISAVSSTTVSSVTVLQSSVESNKCSSNNESTNLLANKSTVENFAESIIQINNNNNNKEVVTVPVKSPLETLPPVPKTDGVVQNGISPRTNVILEINSKTQVASNKAKIDEKKLKEKSVKTVPDEFVTKQSVSSKPASENGDFYSAEPVVFCGGKFDSTQLPVGQKIGFEFGFGVIEALNDNNGVVETAINGPKSIGFTTVGNSVEICATPTSAVASDIVFRFQDKSIAVNCKDSSTCVLKSAPLTNEELPPTKPYEKSLRNPPNTQKSNEKSQGATNPAPTTTTGESANVPRVASTVPTSHQLAHDSKSSTTAAFESSPASEVPQGHDSSKLSGVTSDNTASITATASSPSSDDSVALKETTPKVDIAQIYIPPKNISVPDSVHQAAAFMENYASRLTSKLKEGKLSFHRIA